jgi:hypothetical protein
VSEHHVDAIVHRLQIGLRRTAPHFRSLSSSSLFCRVLG